ncbi:hypothetical protein RCOM_1596040 [Ricinus communis]|uniref:Uncharacterized protein n=1 Tax=Ricinus communis TaxID=3988 RepID=B9R820_RICCO|nr:hypothetical protein RCOM_1596040 [Ricinus communis]
MGYLRSIYPSLQTVGDGKESQRIIIIISGLLLVFSWPRMPEPQPSYPALREASFVPWFSETKNRTYAFFSWHHNQDGVAVEADSVRLTNRYWSSLEESPLHVTVKDDNLIAQRTYKLTLVPSCWASL